MTTTSPTRPSDRGPTSASARLRTLCLALPEAIETTTWERPTYRIRDKIFTMERERESDVAAWMKAPPGSQTVLVGADAHRFFVPPYVGPKGWIGVRLDDGVDWDEVAVLVRRSYRLIAPRRLAVQVAEPARVT